VRTKFELLNVSFKKENKLITVSKFLVKPLDFLWPLYGGCQHFHKIAQFEFDIGEIFEFEELPYGNIIYTNNKNIYIYESGLETTLIELIHGDNIINGTIYNIDDFYLHIMFKYNESLRKQFLVILN